MEKLKLWFNLERDAFINARSRKSSTRNIVSVTTCIVAAVIVSLLIAAMLGNNPFSIISDLFTKGFVDYKTLIWNIVILGIGGLSFSFAFKAGVFNIGIPGQMLMSGFMVLVISRAMQDAGIILPTGLGPILMLLVAMLFGALIASITSLLKVLFNVNDVVSAILLNWIILFAVRALSFKYYNPDPNIAFAQTVNIPDQFQLVAPGIGGWLPTLIIFIILVLGIFLICKYTTFGHKVAAVGGNQFASAYAGYNVKAIQISTMAISGALAGVMAMILYTAGLSPSIPLTRDFDALPAQGLNGIAIGLIALNNPIAIVPVAFIMGLFSSSAPFLQVNPAFSQLIMGLIILGAAMFVVLANYHPFLWFKKFLYGQKVVEEYKNYENNMELLISKYRLEMSETKDVIEIQMLQKNYQEEKEVIKNEYLKNIIILKATRKFLPMQEAKNAIEMKQHALDQQYIRYENKQNKKLRRLQEKVANNIAHSSKQLLSWKEEAQNQTPKYFAIKSKLFGSDESNYQKLYSQINSSTLSEKDKQELKHFVDKAYHQVGTVGITESKKLEIDLVPPTKMEELPIKSKSPKSKTTSKSKTTTTKKTSSRKTTAKKGGKK